MKAFKSRRLGIRVDKVKFVKLRLFVQRNSL